MAGGAYLFYRKCELSTKIEQYSSRACKWIQQQRIVASDKRQGNKFGVSVAIDDALGLVLVGMNMISLLSQCLKHIVPTHTTSTHILLTIRNFI